MPLQDDAAAARHLRDFGELDDQHPAVVADKGDRVAVSACDADRGAAPAAGVNTCLPARVCATASSPSTTKPRPSFAATSSSMPGR